MAKKTETKAVAAKTSNPRRLIGVVASAKMKDTVIVNVTGYVKHPKYGKFYTRNKRYAVHNPGNKAQEGDKVTIVESKPISKTKKFIIAD